MRNEARMKIFSTRPTSQCHNLKSQSLFHDAIQCTAYSFLYRILFSIKLFDKSVYPKKINSKVTSFFMMDRKRKGEIWKPSCLHPLKVWLHTLCATGAEQKFFSQNSWSLRLKFKIIIETRRLWDSYMPIRNTYKHNRMKWIVGGKYTTYYLHGSKPKSRNFLLCFSSLLAQQHGFLFCNSRLLCQQISCFLWTSLYSNAHSLQNKIQTDLLNLLYIGRDYCSNFVLFCMNVKLVLSHQKKNEDATGEQFDLIRMRWQNDGEKWYNQQLHKL